MSAMRMCSAMYSRMNERLECKGELTDGWVHEAQCARTARSADPKSSWANAMRLFRICNPYARLMATRGLAQANAGVIAAACRIICFFASRGRVPQCVVKRSLRYFLLHAREAENSALGVAHTAVSCTR